MTAVTTLFALPSFDDRYYTKYPNGDLPISCVSDQLDDTYWTPQGASFIWLSESSLWETVPGSEVVLPAVAFSGYRIASDISWAPEGYRPNNVILTLTAPDDSVFPTDVRVQIYTVSQTAPLQPSIAVDQTYSVSSVDPFSVLIEIDWSSINESRSFGSIAIIERAEKVEISCIQIY